MEEESMIASYILFNVTVDSWRWLRYKMILFLFCVFQREERNKTTHSGNNFYFIRVVVVVMVGGNNLDCIGTSVLLFCKASTRQQQQHCRLILLVCLFLFFLFCFVFFFT